jgi:hypothetical protein
MKFWFMEVARLDGAPHLPGKKSCRNDWEGLDPNTLKLIFAGLRAGDVTPKDIPSLIMMSLYDEYLKICDLKCEVLNNCLDEDIQCRILRALPVTKAPEATQPPVADLDCSSANVLAVAKDLFKIWIVVVGKRTRPCPWLAALGAKLMSMHGDRGKQKKGKVIQYQ